MTTDQKIIVALDYPDAASALAFVSRISPELARVKVGKELFTAAGPALVEELVKRGYSVFLDLKFHDIPNTVAQAVKAAANLGVWMLNVHALGGRQMLLAARGALGNAVDRPRLIAVTLLTSLDSNDAADVGLPEPAILVPMLAGLANECGLDGVVCSAQEATTLKRLCGNAFLLVTPGIRPAGSVADDQRRIMTPKDAVAAGADYLVIGRPITGAADPIAVLQSISSELVAT